MCQSSESRERILQNEAKKSWTLGAYRILVDEKDSDNTSPRNIMTAVHVRSGRKCIIEKLTREEYIRSCETSKIPQLAQLYSNLVIQFLEKFEFGGEIYMVNEWFGPNIIDFLMAELNSRDHVINIAAKLGDVVKEYIHGSVGIDSVTLDVYPKNLYVRIENMNCVEVKVLPFFQQSPCHSDNIKVRGFSLLKEALLSDRYYDSEFVTEGVRREIAQITALTSTVEMRTCPGNSSDYVPEDVNVYNNDLVNSRAEVIPNEVKSDSCIGKIDNVVTASITDTDSVDDVKSIDEESRLSLHESEMYTEKKQDNVVWKKSNPEVGVFCEEKELDDSNDDSMKKIHEGNDTNLNVGKDEVDVDRRHQDVQEDDGFILI